MDDRKTQNFITDIADLQRGIEEFKGSQPVGGASFVNYDVQGSANGGLYDFAVSVPNVLNTIYKRAWRVSFTHDTIEGQDAKLHIVRPSVFFRLDNPNVMAAPYLANISRLAQIDVINEPPVNGLNTFLLDMKNLDTTDHTLYVKIFFKATTPGTFSAAQVWP